MMLQKLSGWEGILKSLESQNKTNDIVAEIINISMNNRILSLYTAFLALEPNFIPDEDNEDGELSDAEDLQLMTISG